MPINNSRYNLATRFMKLKSHAFFLFIFTGPHCFKPITSVIYLSVSCQCPDGCSTGRSFGDGSSRVVCSRSDGRIAQVFEAFRPCAGALTVSRIPQDYLTGVCVKVTLSVLLCELSSRASPRFMNCLHVRVLCRIASLVKSTGGVIFVKFRCAWLDYSRLWVVV